MTAQSLAAVAQAMVAPGKGILAADESSGTIKKRFDSIKLESTAESRRAYRDMLFTTPGASEFISGVILYDETLRQSTLSGVPFPKYLAQQGMIPGIKVDAGAKALAGFPGETVTEGLDGLRERLKEYAGLGAKFAKWRAVIAIGPDFPGSFSLAANAHALARYAALCQEAGIVPIVEPEVLMDGDHTIGRCEEVTTAALERTFIELRAHRVDFAGMVLKPNMVVPGPGLQAEGLRARGCGSHDPLPEGDGARHRAGHRVPVRRPESRGVHGAPGRHEHAGRAALAAHVLLRTCPAGTFPQGLGRQARGGEGRAGGVLQARPPEWPGSRRPVPARDGSRLTQ